MSLPKNAVTALVQHKVKSFSLLRQITRDKLINYLICLVVAYSLEKRTPLSLEFGVNV